jgi:pimeloyl-ACP methyl ester carboxylesterase
MTYIDNLFDRSGTVKRPDWRLFAAEGGKFAKYVVAPGPRPEPSAAPRGDGHPVIIIPAFLSSDRSTVRLRRFLSQLGYEAHGWGLRTNLGPTQEALDGLTLRILGLHAKHKRKVSLIGASLGGVFAREFAKKHPDEVRQVITLCSPFRLPTATHVEMIFRLAARRYSPEAEMLWATMAVPPVVPITAVYTRTDGIVAWQSCLEEEGPHRENVEVTGCHSTIAGNRMAAMIIADRLSQKEGEWRRYKLCE